MRYALAVLLLVAALSLPVQAQLRSEIPGRPSPVVVSESPGGASLASYFNRNTFKFSQSYEMSFSSFGGGGSLGLGIYTTSLRWQPTDRLAARVDVGLAHSPFGTGEVRDALGFDQDTPARLFLRNAELAYRPTENSIVRLQFQQSPYGRYASPYGAYSPYGYGYSPYGYGGGSSFRATFGSAEDDLFWRTPR